MSDLTLLVILIAACIVGVILKRQEKSRAHLHAMTDCELLEAMNMGGHFDSKYRREFMRRHSYNAMKGAA